MPRLGEILRETCPERAEGRRKTSPRIPEVSLDGEQCLMQDIFMRFQVAQWKRIDLIAWARPNFMKIAPIIEALKAFEMRGGSLRFRLIHAGQHV